MFLMVTAAVTGPARRVGNAYTIVPGTPCPMRDDYSSSLPQLLDAANGFTMILKDFSWYPKTVVNLTLGLF
jgi:hypothetical protein